MYLRRLELHGFKSFADKTELEFVKGITAVVGPNGSGKSNISDSIRWVLGEQSARSLRGGKMEDIIFAGSDARKAVNFGEVSLTLDNSDQALPLDFTEVTVTRRLHRSGDSEYFINKQACRLKDITELFMDTGIGKEAYSIIGQGRIEEILSSRSEDRRGIFEEASGIVKYKSRKKEAEKKLSETEQNLLRIHDLVSELEDQIEPLKDQAEKAVKYKQFKEQLTSSEISLYVHQIEQLHQSWTEATDAMAALQREQMELSTVVNKHDAELEQRRLETRRLEEELEALQQSLLRLSEETEKSEGQSEVLKERRRNLAANREQLEQMIATQERRSGEKQTELGTYRVKLAEITRSLSELQQTVALEEQRLAGVHGVISSAKEEQLKADLFDVLNRMAQSRNEIRYAEQNVESIARRMDRLAEERSKWIEQRDMIERRRSELHRQIDLMSQELEQVRNRYVTLGEELKQKQGLYSEAQLMVRKWEQKLEALLSRRDTMKELQNDYDGFAHGVREVLKAKDRKDGLQGIHGAVAELIQVPAEYETAMETALGAALQNIVVETEAEGREAIAFLKKRQLGRATFLPLNVIRGRSVPPNDRNAIQSVDGYVGIASELVRYDSKYDSIIGSLLGNVIVSRDLEQANRIAAKCQYRYRVVTLEGDVVNAGGSMTGGSVHKKGANLLGRSRQIEELEKEIATSSQQLQQLREKADEVKREISEWTETMEELRRQGEQRRVDEQQLRGELNQLESEARNAEAQVSLSSQDQDSLQMEIEGHKGKGAAAETELKSLAEEEYKLQQQIAEAEAERKAGESQKEQLNAQLTELKVQAASVSQEKQSIADHIRRLEAEHREQQSEFEASRLQLENMGREAEALELQSVSLIEELNAFRLQKQACTEQTEFKRAERAEKLKLLEYEENKTRDERIQLRQTEEKLHQMEVRVNRLDVELDNLLKKLSDDYELSYELAKERYPVPEDLTATQNQVRELKRQISMLGDVNLGAIEEYARVSERFEFLSTQKTDLIEAKTALYHVIREIDEEMSKRFLHTFQAIRSHFSVVFSKLFGGGRADLILSEPDNLLDTGVDIVAQPPGKKLQNLQLLSGGERALTALALLFAILQVKPVPFCVLDEVEAALDEANVARFASYLREFSDDTQFIVVTHRKGTMEEADVLYGVTMEEGGVSKLVSVRLEEDDDAISA
jgi:chromosome segregation protein